MVSERKIPEMEDFSTSAIKKHVTHRIKQNMITWLAPAAGLGAGFFTFVLADVFVASFVALFGVAVGLGSFGADHIFRKHSYKSEYIREFKVRMKERADKVAKYLTHEFDVRYMEDQHLLVKKLETFRSNFERVVSHKFAEGESTHDRYMGVAEGLYVGSLNKLEKILSIHIASADIDVKDNERKLEKLDRRTGEASKRQAAAIRERLESRKSSMAEIRMLTAEVEETLTGLAELARKVSQVTNDSSEQSFENFWNDVKSLMNETNLYVSEKSL